MKSLILFVDLLVALAIFVSLCFLVFNIYKSIKDKKKYSLFK